MKESNIVDKYIKEVLMKSWTWDRLTQKERQRFLNMDVFYRIDGNDSIKIEWLMTIYEAFLIALGYKIIGWRESEEEKEYPRF